MEINILIMGNIHPKHLGFIDASLRIFVRKKYVVFHKLQAALFVVRPHADKIPAKVMLNTRRAVQVKQSQIIYRGTWDFHFVYNWDSEELIPHVMNSYYRAYHATYSFAGSMKNGIGVG